MDVRRLAKLASEDALHQLFSILWMGFLMTDRRRGIDGPRSRPRPYFLGLMTKV